MGKAVFRFPKGKDSVWAFHAGLSFRTPFSVMYLLVIWIRCCSSRNVEGFLWWRKEGWDTVVLTVSCDRTDFSWGSIRFVHASLRVLVVCDWNDKRDCVFAMYVALYGMVVPFLNFVEIPGLVRGRLENRTGSWGSFLLSPFMVMMSCSGFKSHPGWKNSGLAAQRWCKLTNSKIRWI